MSLLNSQTEYSALLLPQHLEMPPRLLHLRRRGSRRQSKQHKPRQRGPAQLTRSEYCRHMGKCCLRRLTLYTLNVKMAYVMQE